MKGLAIGRRGGDYPCVHRRGDRRILAPIRCKPDGRRVAVCCRRGAGSAPRRSLLVSSGHALARIRYELLEAAARLSDTGARRTIPDCLGRNRQAPPRERARQPAYRLRQRARRDGVRWRSAGAGPGRGVRRMSRVPANGAEICLPFAFDDPVRRAGRTAQGGARAPMGAAGSVQRPAAPVSDQAFGIARLTGGGLSE